MFLTDSPSVLSSIIDVIICLSSFTIWAVTLMVNLQLSLASTTGLEDVLFVAGIHFVHESATKGLDLRPSYSPHVFLLEVADAEGHMLFHPIR